MDQLPWYGKATAIKILKHFFSSYGEIDKINLAENAVNIMKPYKPTEHLARLIDKLKKGREFERSGGQTTADAMIVSK